MRHRFAKAALALAAAVALDRAATPLPAATFTWTGQALTPLWNQNSFGVTNWAGNVFPTSSASTQLVFNNFINQSTAMQNMADPFDLNRLTFGGSAFVLNGQPLRFMADGSTSPQIVLNTNSPQLIDQPVVLGANLAVGGTGNGTFTFAGSVTGSTSDLQKSGVSRLALAGGGTYRSLTSSGAGVTYIDGGETTLTATGTQSAINLQQGGELVVRNAATVQTSGSVSVTGTTATIRDPGTSLTAGQAVVGTTPSSSFLSIDTGGAMNVGSVIVAASGNGIGDLTIRRGATVTSSYASIGRSGIGFARLDNNGSSWITDQLRVGDGSTGICLVSTEARVTSQHATIGTAGGAGTVSVNNPGTTWTTADLTIGDGGSGNVNVGDFGRVTVTGETQLGGSIDINGGNFQTETLTSNSGVITITDSADGLYALTVGAGRFGGRLSDGAAGAGSLLKVGDGTFTLGGGSADTLPNFYTGRTHVSGGTLVLDKAATIDAIGDWIEIDGGTLRTERDHQIPDSAAVTLSDGTLELNGSQERIGSLAGFGNAAVNLRNSDLLVRQIGSTFFNGSITGTSASRLEKEGIGTLAIAGSVACGQILAIDGGLELSDASVLLGNHAAPLFVDDNGSLLADHGTTISALAHGSASTIDGQLVVSGNDTTLRVDHLTVSSNNGVGGGTVTIRSGGDLTASIVECGQEHHGEITVTDSGSSLSTGMMKLLDGQLNVVRGATANANITSFERPSGAVLNADGGSFTTAAIVSIVSGGTIKLSDPAGGTALTVGGGDSDSYFDGSIIDSAGGPGGFRKVGSRTFVLGGGSLDAVANTYSGLTRVSDGTLLLNKAVGRNAIVGDTLIDGGRLLLARSEQIASNALVTVNAGTFDLAGYSERIGGLDGGPGGFVSLGAGSLTVSENDTSMFAGTIAGAGGRLIKQGSGTLILAGAGNTYSGPTIVTAGRLAVTRSGALGGGTLQINLSGRALLQLGDTGAARVSALEVVGNGMLDLTDSELVVGRFTTKPQLAAGIALARNGGGWDGPGGITSSTAAAQPDHATMIGLLDRDEYAALYGTGATFGGQPLADGDKLLKYTWYGDTDFNGVVNFDDYVRADNGFNNHLSGWLNGDFDLNGAVNFDDYVLIDLAFNTQTGTLGRALSFLDGSDRSAADMTSPALRQVVDHFGQFGSDYAGHFIAAVPEPAFLSFASGLAVSAAMLRRRRRQF